MTASGDEYAELLDLARHELERLVRRLQGLSALAWTSRRDAVVLALGRLAELDAVAERRAVPSPPDLASFALSDAIAVIGGDVLAALEAVPDSELIAAVIVEVRAALEATR